MFAIFIYFNHDSRFGFMLCWGTLCFMPLVHTLQNLYLVRNRGLKALASPSSSSNILMAMYLLLGNLMTFVNYDSDTQRHRVRQSRGKCLVWGRPATFLRAPFKTSNGQKHVSLLSTCGYNRLSRHFHYLPDIINLVLYCSPAGFAHILPHFYFIYLTILLLDRTYRIDERCRSKYGVVWDQYCHLVPYRLIPYIW